MDYIKMEKHDVKKMVEHQLIILFNKFIQVIKFVKSKNMEIKLEKS